MERKRAISRIYSQSALAQAGAFVRMQEIKESVAYVKRYLHEHPELNGRAPSAAPVSQRKVAPVVKAKRKPREPEVGNGFSVSVAVARREAALRQIKIKPSTSAGKSLRRRCEEIVTELSPTHRDGVRPFEVAKVLATEGWQFQKEAEPSVRAALRHCPNLLQRKTGPSRGAAVFYTVRP